MANTVLVVAAHSDDEALGCAGTIAKHVSHGDKVISLFMTDGVSSRSGGDGEVGKRTGMARAVSDLLGISSMINLNFPDNKMDSIALLNIVQDIEKVIDEMQPDIIYTHHLGDLNIDHQVTHKAVMTACRPQPGFYVKEIYAFEVLSSTEWKMPGHLPFEPNVFVDISDYIDQKRKALKAYASEMRPEPHSRSIDNAIRLSQVRGNAVGVDYAEAFMSIRVIR